jgi:CRP-like cAMP-binding protein
MVIKTLIKLDKKTTEKLKAVCRVQQFTSPTPLFYQGHVPMVAYLVIDGSVNLLKNKKIKQTVKAGGVIGVKELLERTPSSVTAETSPNTTICYLDHSTVKDSELSSFFENLSEPQVS